MPRIYQKDFSYFNGPNLFCSDKIIKGEPPNIKRRPSKQSQISEGTGSKEEDRRREAVIREFVGEHGKGVRQENVCSKTKELTGTLPYALSMRPSFITASSEDCHDVTTACQIEDANEVLQAGTVRVQTVYHNKDVVAVRHNRRREISPFWLAILLQDVQLEVDGGNFLRKKVQFQWLNGDVCDRNSPNFILTRVLGFTAEGSSITLTSEKDNRLCRLANGDLDDEDIGDDEDQTPEDEAAGESEREVSLPRLAGVSLLGRRTTCFQL